jgi:hypothetical protein
MTIYVECSDDSAFHYLPANQAVLFSVARPTKKPDTTFFGRSDGVIKTIPRFVQRREYNTVSWKGGGNFSNG